MPPIADGRIPDAILIGNTKVKQLPDVQDIEQINKLFAPVLGVRKVSVRPLPTCDMMLVHSATANYDDIKLLDGSRRERYAWYLASYDPHTKQYTLSDEPVDGFFNEKAGIKFGFLLPAPDSDGNPFN